MTAPSLTPSLTSPVADARGRRLRRTLAVLFGAHFAGIAVPLVTVPWLARVLGPAGWAPVLVAQGLAAWAILVLEFGFDLAGTRAVAQAGSPDALALAAARVQRARLLLTGPVASVTLLVGWLLPTLSMRLVLVTTAYVLARGLSPYWFFQGVQRIRFATTVETLAKVLPALAVFVVVRGPADGWRVLAALALFGMLGTATLTFRLHQTTRLPRTRNADALEALREAAPMFATRAASGLYLQANTLLLSFIAPAAIATYGGGERLVRAAINLLTPVTQGVFPHVSRLAAEDAARADAAVRRALLLLGGAGLAAAAVGMLLAGPLVRVLLGAQYLSSVPVVRVLVLTIPLIAVGTVLGTYWALSVRKERLFLFAVVLGGVVNLALFGLLVPRFGAVGMAAGVVLAEATVTTTLWRAWRRHPR